MVSDKTPKMDLTGGQLLGEADKCFVHRSHPVNLQVPVKEVRGNFSEGGNQQVWALLVGQPHERDQTMTFVRWLDFDCRGSYQRIWNRIGARAYAIPNPL